MDTDYIKLLQIQTYSNFILEYNYDRQINKHVLTWKKSELQNYLLQSGTNIFEPDIF